MFQNLSNDTEEEIIDDKKDNEGNNTKKEIIKQTFSMQNCIIYVLSFFMSMAGDTSSILTVAPFGFAIIAASVGAQVPVMMVCISCLLGSIIKFGTSYLLTKILTILLFLASILIIKPRIQYFEYEVNEKQKVGLHIFLAVLATQIIPMFFKTFYIYDLLYGIMLAISTLILYKIFVNSLVVFKDLKIKKVFSLEEVIGASLILVIAISSIGDLSIFGFSIRNILTILVILILGWKNGMLIGATGGLTIGLTLSIIQGEPIEIIAAYAISGLVAGLLNRLGKIGVIVGFIIGNIVLTYISNGHTVEIIRFQEILIAGLGLLAMPKSAGIKVSDLIDEYKLLPETTGRTLEENKETIYKLNNMSDTISQIAKEYGEVAAAVVTDDDEELLEENEKIFENEIKSNLADQEENLLYDDIYNNENNILKEILEILEDRGLITRKDIITLFAKHNNYIIGYDEEKNDKNYEVEKDIDDMIRIINTSYNTGKLNFIWKKKLEANRKSISNQLSGVSEAISNLAQNITVNDDTPYKAQKEEIKSLLKEKDVILKDIVIKKEVSGRYIINLYTNICDSIDGKGCALKKISQILEKVFKEKMVLQKQECGLRIDDNTCIFTFTSIDKYKMQVGVAKSKKFESIISGDTTVQTRLEDGKYLLAISDGMGSGPEARKSSKIAIKMLERLLESGFNKDTALKLINSTISNNKEDDDMYATLDVNVIDLFSGNMEYFKNGACPTFLKRNKETEILNAVSLPTGILENIDLVEYNHDLKDGDIIVICSDGVIDSCKDFNNKELWIKYLLEDLETDDAQRIADIILNEARDNDFGEEKDDMTVICCRISLSK